MDSNFNILNATLCLNISDIAIIFIKIVNYCCIIRNITKSEAINLSEIFFLEDQGYL